MIDGLTSGVAPGVGDPAEDPDEGGGRAGPGAGEAARGQEEEEHRVHLEGVLVGTLEKKESKNVDEDKTLNVRN